MPELQAKMRLTLEEKLTHLKEDTYAKAQGGDAHQVTIGLYKYFLLLRYEKQVGMMDDVKLAAKVAEVEEKLKPVMEANVEALQELKSTDYELNFLMKRRDSIEALVELAALSIDKKPEDLIDLKLLEGP